MREYLMQDWTLVIVLMLVMVVSILCQLIMMHSMNTLIKEREELDNKILEIQNYLNSKEINSNQANNFRSSLSRYASNGKGI